MEAGFILMMILHIILIGVGVRYKDNLIVAKILAVWLFILVGFNQGGPDITNYRVMYKQFGINGSYHFPGLDSLYGNWWVMSADLHWSMLISTVVITALLSIPLYFGIKRITKNVSLVYSLMYIYPIFDLVIQRRNFAAMVVIIFAVKWLIVEDKWGWLKYAVAVVIAAGFHQMAILFLIFAFVPYLSKNKSLYWSFGVTALAAVGLYFATQFAGLIFSPVKVKLYLSAAEQYPLPKALVFMTVHIVLVGWMILSYYWLPNNKQLGKSKSMLVIAINSLVFLPLYLFSPVFFRYVRILLPVFYGFNYDEIENRKLRMLSIVGIFGYAILRFVGYIGFGTYGVSEVLIPLFTKNALFEYVINWLG